MGRNKNKSLSLMLVVLVVLAGAAFLLANPFAKPKTDVNGAVAVGKGGSQAKVLIDLKKDAVSGVSILQPKQTEFKLEKKDDKWQAVQGDKRFKADQDKVDKILAALPGLTSESFASSNADKYKDYGLDDATAVKVGIYTGGDKPAATLLVGNSAPGATSSYVRVDDGKEIWRTATNVKALVGFSFKDYRSKQPWDFDPQVVKSLTVRPVDGQPDTYTYDNGVWKQASGANANMNDITKLLEDWSKATVSDFADDVTPGVTTLTPAADSAAPADGAKSPPAAAAAPTYDVGTQPNLTVQTPQGSFSLTLGQKDGSLYYVADQDKLVYKISEPAVAFFRNLKFDELKIPAAADQKTMSTPAPGGGTGAAGAAPKPGTPPATPPATPATPPATPGTPPAKPGAPPATPPATPPAAPPAKPAAPPPAGGK
jgi:hypothetical protein